MNMTSTTKRGFTLIELLVVIAIIGILSSVVLASLNTARSRGTDANIKANLATIAVQAELYYDSNSNQYAGSSVTACNAASSIFADTTISQAITEVQSRSSDVDCTANTTVYAVSAHLPGVSTTTDDNYCIDSTGFRGTIDTPLGTGTSCSGANGTDS